MKFLLVIGLLVTECCMQGDAKPRYPKGSSQDLIFLLDGSGSVGADFVKVRNWVKMITGKLDLSDTQVGVIQFSHWIRGRDVDDQRFLRTEISLGRFKDHGNLEAAIDDIRLQGYTTYTAHAINKTVEDFRQSDRFDDTAVKKIMILVTDGKSTDREELPASAAYARSQGITIFAVGVEGYALEELQIIATGEVGNNERVYEARHFSDLQLIVDTLHEEITGCRGEHFKGRGEGRITEARLYSLENKSGLVTSQTLLDRTNLFISGDTTPRYSKGSSLDLIFLLDGSGSVGADFVKVRNWVKTITGRLDLNDTQVGVIQFSHWMKGRRMDDQRYLRTEISLGRFKDHGNLKAAIDDIRLQGYTTYTAHAIKKTVEDFKQSDRFNDTAVKKIMILVTDGKSTDRSDLPVSAAYARSQGITIFAVGVEGYVLEELQIIATGEVGNNERVYEVRNFSDLQLIADTLHGKITARRGDQY